MESHRIQVTLLKQPVWVSSKSKLLSEKEFSRRWLPQGNPGCYYLKRCAVEWEVPLGRTWCRTDQRSLISFQLCYCCLAEVFLESEVVTLLLRRFRIVSCVAFSRGIREGKQQWRHKLLSSSVYFAWHFIPSFGNERASLFLTHSSFLRLSWGSQRC